MKKLFVSLVLLLFINSSAIADNPSFLHVRLVICETTTEADLKSMISFMEANDYILTIEDISYNSDGTVNSVQGTVDFGKTPHNFNSGNISENPVIITKSLLGKVSVRVGQN